MDTFRRVDILEGTLKKQLSWIAAADAKTGFIFGVTAAMLGLLASAAPGYGKWTPLGVTLTITAAALLFGSLACDVLTIFPRTEGPKSSVIFFGAIASRDIDVFRTGLQSLTDESYEEDLVQQCHINASIAGQKYYWVKCASVLLAASVMPWAAAAYVLFRDR